MLLLPMAMNADDSGSCGDNLTYTYVESTMTLTISGVGAMKDYTYTDGSANTRWWSYRRSIQTIIIEYGVTSIGKFAFYGCSNLISVTIPSSVTSIERRAFTRCTGLKSITIPNSVTFIGDGVFAQCESLASVTIPNSVTTIENSVFYYCSGLTSITIPNNVKSIGDNAFEGCERLTSLTIPNSVKSIGNVAFGACIGLTTIISKIANPFVINSKVFKTDIYTTATLIVPEGTKSAYQSTAGWSNFQNIVENVEMEKCAKPTISLKNGKIIFECETEGVEFMPQVTPLNESSYANGEMMLPNKYRITVYATKEGYNDSDVATLDVEIPVATKGDVNVDGVVDAADIVSVVNIIMSNETSTP